MTDSTEKSPWEKLKEVAFRAADDLRTPAAVSKYLYEVLVEIDKTGDLPFNQFYLQSREAVARTEEAKRQRTKMGCGHVHANEETVFGKPSCRACCSQRSAVADALQERQTELRTALDTLFRLAGLYRGSDGTDGF